jgi:Recombination endonuclease VII
MPKQKGRPPFQEKPGLKRCSRCKENKSYEAFHKNRTGKYGLQNECKACYRRHQEATKLRLRKRYEQIRQDPEWKKRHALYQRKARFKHRYGITLDDYDQMVEKQGGGCAICHAKVAFQDGRKLCVDHNHETGEVRGILCGLCNSVLGHIENNHLLDSFIAYADLHGIRR